MTRFTPLSENSWNRSAEKPGSPVEYAELAYGWSLRDSPTAHLIVIVLEGEGSLGTEEIRGIPVGRGDIRFFAAGDLFRIEAETRMKVLLFRYESNFRLPDTARTEPAETDRNLPEGYGVKIKEGLSLYLAGIRQYLSEGGVSGSFMEHKSVELLYLLGLYYAPGELRILFHGIFDRDRRFSEFVFDNWRKVKTIKELADISIYSESNFRRKFTEVFHVSPYKWLNRKKAALILHDLTDGGLPFKELAEKYRFGSVQQFTGYCKKNLGSPPGKIRSGHLRRR